MGAQPQLRIEPATEDDVGLVLTLVNELADYEKMSDDVVATEDDVRRSLFSKTPSAEALIARVGGDAPGPSATTSGA